MRSLSEIEKQRLKILTRNSVSLTLIEPTETALKKSIMDATGSVRNYLKRSKYHDYDLQAQGPNNKIIIKSFIYTNTSKVSSRASLYRPKTKKGDPRIWFSGLRKHSNPNDIFALICFNKNIHVLNLTQLPIEKFMGSIETNPLQELVNEINGIENLIAQELLGKLKKIAQQGPIPSLINADTSVGRTLETALGIAINSSKQPDYKGIELKSFRARKGNRKNLFAQVPNWNLSKFKSSAEILDAFGYWREEDFKLYCTVSTLRPNSQGLTLRIDSKIKHLIENSDKEEVGDFVVWTLDQLHERLLTKHKETFWITTDSIFIESKEYFHYTKVEHTKKPILSHFDILLEQGIITLDHLIKRNAQGKVKEKGPIFKLKPDALNLLFPPSKKYSLTNS